MYKVNVRQRFGESPWNIYFKIIQIRSVHYIGCPQRSGPNLLCINKSEIKYSPTYVRNALLDSYKRLKICDQNITISSTVRIPKRIQQSLF